ncbi:hypothetical protein UlMin_014166 [Ulmus minor]
MLRSLAILGQNLQNMRKSPRVADESMFGDGNNQVEFPINPHDHDHDHHMQRRSWKGFSIIYGVVRAPILSLFSCFSQAHHVNGSGSASTYGVWVSGEFAQISEMNHLMVSDSMRYAILM